jgi:hypothetical protein
MIKPDRSRHRKALMWALFALALGSVPMAARVWLEKNGAMEQPTLGVVGEFVIRDENDRPLTRDQLRRALTLILYWPKNCISAPSCQDARTRIQALRSWVEATLEPGWTEEKNQLHLIIVGEGALDLEASGRWRRFPESFDVNTLLPATAALDQPWLVVVDNVLQFSALESLNGELDFARLGRVISKTSFDQYLGNYLSRRTFMGPKRTQN